MPLSNSSDPAVREAVVRQDLGNVLHPIVQHKTLEPKQMVVTGGEGSTIFDADCTDYLDAIGRAVVRQYRLWPQRACRGRRGADAATVVLPAHRDELARSGPGREDQRTDGRRLPPLALAMAFLSGEDKAGILRRKQQPGAGARGNHQLAAGGIMGVCHRLLSFVVSLSRLERPKRGGRARHRPTTGRRRRSSGRAIREA